MIYITYTNIGYEIKFSYDEELISIIKAVPGRIWDPQNKRWIIPVDKLGWFINRLKGTKYENSIRILSPENINENQSISTTLQTEIPNIDISDVEQHVIEGGHLYNHQIDFLKYAKSRNGRGFILADDMGAGKTLEMLNYALYQRKRYKYKRCLIICCVNSAKYNWQSDIETHTNGLEHPYILGTRKKRKGGFRCRTSGTCKLEDLQSLRMYGKDSEQELPYFIIMNIESLRMKHNRRYAIAEQIINLINSGEISMVAIDEIHKNVSPKSSQGKLLLTIKDKTKSNAEWIPITGTPIVNRPTDVYLPLKLVDGHTCTNHHMWCSQFVIYGGFGDKEIVGYKNIPYLKELLHNNMIRRLKTDILDLPEKVYYTEYIENSEYQEKLYTSIQTELQSKRDEIQQINNPMTSFLRLRQVNGSPELVDSSLKIDDKYISKNAKLSRLLELIDDIVERGEKVLVFSNWVEPLKTLYKFVSKKYKTTCFVGSMSDEERQKHKRIFINNPDYKVMLGTIGAMGTTHTFTVANNVIFYDSPWDNATRVQCEDRCHRIGSTCPTNIFTLITKDTIDEQVYEIINNKRTISNFIVDDKIDLQSNPELLDIILGNKPQ